MQRADLDCFAQCALPASARNRRKEMNDGAEEHLQQKRRRWVCRVKRVTSVHPTARVRLCLQHGTHENARAPFTCTRLYQISFDAFGQHCADALVSCGGRHDTRISINATGVTIARHWDSEEQRPQHSSLASKQAVVGASKSRQHQHCTSMDLVPAAGCPSASGRSYSLRSQACPRLPRGSAARTHRCAGIHDRDRRPTKPASFRSRSH
jgi:hypothetical protein